VSQAIDRIGGTPHTGHMTQGMVISNSEVNEYYNCQRSHYYHFILGLEPKVLPTRLERGVVGHKALEIIYTVKDNGGTPQEALEQATHSILEASLTFLQSSYSAEDKTHRNQMYIDLMALMQEYITKYWDEDNIETVALEQVYKVPISSTVTLGCRIDRLGIYKTYPYKGDFVVIDWKFRANFLTPQALKLNGQLPKYIWATARALDIPVTKGFMDILRYRELKDSNGKFGRPEFKTKPAVRDKIIALHSAIAEEIVEKKYNSPSRSTEL